MSVLEVHDVSIRYMTGDFKDIGLKEYLMRKLTDNYRVVEFWADHHITFSLEKGDMLGIIGTNGAGKSTLLKAVSGIMEPTDGYVKREGNIAALLELASGFDGDLTVRENTYLRGAMLGYTRKFMDEKYPEIIEFAELQDFQDRPFKQLSSGMMSRLAFSVASLVHPDILILDEVLSVGDGAFRRKSEAKMREIIGSGATTILVSHAVEQVRAMCNKVLWIERGNQIGFGDTNLLCDLYQEYLDGTISLEEAREKLKAAGVGGELEIADRFCETQPSEETSPELAAGRRYAVESTFNRRGGNVSGDRIFLLGVFVLSLFFFNLTITTLLFAVGVPISSINLPIAVLSSTAVCFFLSRRSIKRTIEIFSCAMLLLAITALLSGLVFDWSWDGNQYHKSITGALKWGWNPLHETFYDFARDIPFLSHITQTWYDAYPKLTEIWAASLYAITNNIETGKCFNLLGLAALFCICYAVLIETGAFRKSQIAICSFLCVANPITLSQITTYYVDGYLWQIFLACMAALLYLTFLENGRYKIGCFYIVFISINLGLNIKFSALLYFAVLCICFFGYWVIEKYRCEGWRDSKAWITKRFLLFVLAVIFGTSITGATSYGINLLRHGNPVYTMIGEGSTEIITSQLPDVYKGMSHLHRFIASLLSKTNNNLSIGQVEWKIPFTFSAAEIGASMDCDVRVAGWGYLFSGIFLLSIVVIGIAKTKLSRRHGVLAARIVRVGTVLMGALALCVCFVPGLCWARYSGMLFYIPIAGLLCLFAHVNRRNKDVALPSFVAGALSFALLLNIVPNLVGIKSDYSEYMPIRNQLMEFKALTENANEPVAVGYAADKFEGRFFTLYDMGITNFEYRELRAEDSDGTLFNHDRMLCYASSNEKALMEAVDMLHNSRGKLILLAVKDEGSKGLTKDFVAGMQALGLNFPLEGAYQSSYIAAIKDGEILQEELSTEMISCQIQTGELMAEMVSAGYEKGNIASIKINGTEYAINQRGLNIVIYDTEENIIVDSLCIDTYSNNQITR